MATKTLKTVPKISVKIWRPIIQKFDAKIEDACLRRDAYLNKVLEVELDCLDEEVSIPNSQSSYDYVFERLAQLDLKPVSLALLPALTKRLSEICRRKRIVRDAFFNRLFLLLAASPEVIDTLFFGFNAKEWRDDVWKEEKDDDKFFQDGFYPLESRINPFWAIRSGMEMYARDGGLEEYVEPLSGKTIQVSRDFATGTAEPASSLYTTFLDHKMNVDQNGRGADLLGLNCYVPDWRIPENTAEHVRRTKLDDLLGGLL